MGEGDTTELKAQKANVLLGVRFISCMNISSCYVRLIRVKVNLYPFHRRKYAWDEFLLFVDVLYFILGCSRLLHVIDIKF